MGVVKYRYISPLIAPVWLSIPVSVGPWREFVLWEKVNNGSNRLLKQADMQYLSYMLESSKIYFGWKLYLACPLEGTNSQRYRSLFAS